MSNPILDPMKGNVDMSFNLLRKFLDRCPTEFWQRKWGKWPVWQQFYHMLSAVFLFNPLELKEPLPVSVSNDVQNLKVVGTNPISIEEMDSCLKIAFGHTTAYLDSLNDAELGKINEKVKTIMNIDWTHASTILMIVAHNLYHIGIFDAGLREMKLDGVF
ncbi:MAG: DinB family protein [Deltaproteobacteria bacterium]|nr:DinB family protein [Deltaproteobacteria bacterium]